MAGFGGHMAQLPGILQIYGAITFYLANRTEIDAYLLAEEQEFDSMLQPLETDATSLHQKLIDAKKSPQQS